MCWCGLCLRTNQFMLNRKVRIYWKICWGIVIHLVLFANLVHYLVTESEFTSNGVPYPNVGTGGYSNIFGTLRCKNYTLYLRKQNNTVCYCVRMSISNRFGMFLVCGWLLTAFEVSLLQV